MKVFLVLVLVLAAAAATTAVALGTGVSTSVTAAAVQIADYASEPAVLLLSGSALLALAGAVKRFTL